GREHGERGANVRLTSRVRNLEGFVVHAHVVRRNVEETRQRRVSSWLLVLRTESRRADALVVHVRTLAVVEGRHLGVTDRTAIGLAALVHINAFGPVDRRVVLLSNKQFARCTIPGVAEAVTVKVGGRFALRTTDVELG